MTVFLFRQVEPNGAKPARGTGHHEQFKQIQYVSMSWHLTMVLSPNLHEKAMFLGEVRKMPPYESQSHPSLESQSALDHKSLLDAFCRTRPICGE